MTYVLYIGISGYIHVKSISWLLLGALALFPIAIIGSFFIFKRARTTALLPIPTTLITLLALGIIYTANNFTLTTWLWMSIAYLGWLAYIFWYSNFGKRSSRALKVGHKLPNLALVDENRNAVSTQNLLGTPSLILFYRGNWCPLCMAQIKEIAQQYKDIRNRGIQTVLISPQPEKHTKSLANKFDVPFLYWRDVDYQVAKALEIFHHGGTPLGMEVFGYESDTVMPTVIITNKNNEILFLDMTDNYRVRPEPETFLKVLDGVGV